MLYPRIIPCLLVKNKGLIKTIQFNNPKYVGDPINAAKIFNEKEVDELIVLDIDATIEKRAPDYAMIEKLATECRMPLCYGGGIKNIETAQKIFELGVEKIAISSAAIETPDLIAEIAKRVGSQSVVVVLDIKKQNGLCEIWSNNASINTKINPINFAKKIQELGAGEIVINSINNDGMMNGYDFDLIEKIKNSISIPITALGGAGSLKDIGCLFEKFGIIGAAAGSLFVFKGIYKAVLINYPNKVDKDAIFSENRQIQP